MEVSVFAGSRNSSQRSDLGKIVISLSLSIGLEFCKKRQILHGLYFFVVSISELNEETMTGDTPYKFALLKQSIIRAL